MARVEIPLQTDIIASDILVILERDGWYPVVRCKDCKYYNKAGCSADFGWCERNGSGHGSTDDWFCADGERRGDDER